MRRLAWALCVPLAFSLACDDDDEAKPDDAKPEAAAAGEAAPSEGGAEQASAPKLKGTIEIPAAVPSKASVVLVARTPQSMFDTATAADPFGTLGGPESKALREELDAWFEKSMGLRMLEATAIAGYLVDEKDFAVVLVGVSGEPQGADKGEHAGVTLHEMEGDSVLARVDDLLLFGSENAVNAGIDAAKGAGKAVAGDPIHKLFADHTDGASVAVAVELAHLPYQLRDKTPPNTRLDRGIFVIGTDGISVRAEGEKTQLDTVSGAIKGGLTLLANTADAQRKEAISRGADTAEGAGMIIAAHYAKRMQTMLDPKVDGGALTITIPLEAGDPATLAAVAGMAAAIAIPAFTKYVRRSKTSEARVQIAKMFDAASAYFNEEHVARGSVALVEGGGLAAIAPHQCPNNGKTKGESGITPPLSVDCNEGPGGRCVPTAGGGGGPGSYDMSAWTDNDVWNGLNFQQEQGHYFHYNFIWENDPSGFGKCQFTAQAFGDLDGDGIFSTFERAGAADEYGVNAAAGLYIDQEVE